MAFLFFLLLRSALMALRIVINLFSLISTENRLDSLG
jgi:hypothetical protein